MSLYGFLSSPVKVKSMQRLSLKVPDHTRHATGSSVPVVATDIAGSPSVSDSVGAVEHVSPKESQCLRCFGS